MLLWRRISSTLIIRGLAAVASLGLAALVVTTYSLGIFGEFSFALMTAKMAAGFALLSIDSLLLRLLLRGNMAVERAGRRSIVRECGGMATITSSLAMLAMLVIALVARQISPQEDFWLSLIILLPIVPLQNFAMIQASILRAERRDAAAQMITIGLPTLLPPIIVSLAVFAGYTPRFLPEVVVTFSCLSGAIVGVWLSRTAPFLHIGSSVLALARGKWRIMRYSSAVHSANMMNHLSDWYGTMLLAATQSMEVTGALRIIQQFGAAFHLVSASVEMPLSTEIAKAHYIQDYKLTKALLFKSQFVLTIVGLILAIVTIAGSNFILSAFNANSPETYTALIIFLVLQTAKLLTGAAASALVLIDATRRLINASAAGLMLTIALQSVLVPFFGIIGAATGLGTGVLARAVINYVFVRRELAERSASTSIER